LTVNHWIDFSSRVAKRCPTIPVAPMMPYIELFHNLFTSIMLTVFSSVYPAPQNLLQK